MKEMRLVLRNELCGVPCLCNGHVPSSRAQFATLAIPWRSRLAGVDLGSLNVFECGPLAGSDRFWRGHAEAAQRGLGSARSAGRGHHLSLQIGYPSTQDDAVAAGAERGSP